MGQLNIKGYCGCWYSLCFIPMFEKEKEPALDQRMAQMCQYTPKSYGRFGVG